MFLSQNHPYLKIINPKNVCAFFITTDEDSRKDIIKYFVQDREYYISDKFDNFTAAEKYLIDLLEKLEVVKDFKRLDLRQFNVVKTRFRRMYYINISTCLKEITYNEKEYCIVFKYITGDEMLIGLDFKIEWQIPTILEHIRTEFCCF